MNKTDFVAEQLRALSPGVEWTVSGIDRARELAAIFVRADITDLWSLRLIPVTWGETIPAWRQEWESDYIDHPAQNVTRSGYAFDYYGRQIGFLGTPTRSDSAPALEDRNGMLLIAWSAEGHGNVSYIVSKNAKTGALQFQPIWGSSSDAADIRTAAVTFVSFFLFTALPLAGISAGAAIGNAVLPASIAAGYPALTAAVGNVALSAALNGGDIKGAVKNALTGAVAAGVGGAAELASSSALVGSLAEAGAHAAISGSDVKTAVAFAALKQGAQGMDEFFTLSNDPIFQPNEFASGSFDFSDVGFNQTPEFSFDMDGFSFYVPPAEIVSFIPDAAPLPDVTIFDAAGAFDDPITFNPFSSNSFTNALPVAPANNLPAVPPATSPPNSTNWNPSTIVQGISSAALAALSVVKAYRQLDAPQIQTTARTTRPGGAVSVIGNNGLIQTRAPNGTITATKPPVGVPQATTTGNFVVNNGDGTYSVVAPDGQTRSFAYSGAASESDGITKYLPLIGIGFGVLLLAKRGK